MGSRFDDDRRLTLDLEIRPQAISVPLESGPAVLFGRLALTVALSEPLGRRTLHDAGSLLLRGATEKLDIDRVNSSGSRS